MVVGSVVGEAAQPSLTALLQAILLTEVVVASVVVLALGFVNRDRFT